MTGLSRPYISLLENDESAGARKVDDLEKVAKALRVPLAWMLGMSNEEPDWDEPAEKADSGPEAA
jgi:transcriptional regulator with XRE-family HTH domain